MWEEELITWKVKETPQAKPGFNEPIATTVAGFGGSWKFISSFSPGLVTMMSQNPKESKDRKRAENERLG